jgi:hypothetical protein
VAELPRYQQVETYEPARPSMGQAQALQSLSQKLAAFTQGQQRQADIFAAQEAERAGQAAAAGKKGGVEMQQPGTIRADAFNKGALMAHAAAIQTDIRETTARLETTFATNMEGFQQAMDSYKEGLFTQIDLCCVPTQKLTLTNTPPHPERAFLTQHLRSKWKKTWQKSTKLPKV